MTDVDLLTKPLAAAAAARQFQQLRRAVSAQSK